MTSNRPPRQNQLDLSRTEETCASSAAELQREQSVSAATEKPVFGQRFREPDGTDC